MFSTKKLAFWVCLVTALVLVAIPAYTQVSSLNHPVALAFVSVLEGGPGTVHALPEDPDPAIIGTPKPPTAAELEAIRQQTYTGGVVEVTGPKTRGSTLTVAGELMKLPADVEVFAFVASGDCVPGRKCLPLPVYVLHDVDDNAFISISAQTGQIGFADTEENSKNYAELNTRAAQVFQWIPALHQ
jgi:hypothetical protein